MSSDPSFATASLGASSPIAFLMLAARPIAPQAEGFSLGVTPNREPPGLQCNPSQPMIVYSGDTST